jgi:hypothetical protein
MSIAKIYITIRTQVLPSNPFEEDELVAQGRPTNPVKEVTRRLASGFMTEAAAENKEALARAVLEAILGPDNGEFVEDS